MSNNGKTVGDGLVFDLGDLKSNGYPASDIGAHYGATVLHSDGVPSRSSPVRPASNPAFTLEGSRPAPPLSPNASAWGSTIRPQADHNGIVTTAGVTVNYLLQESTKGPSMETKMINLLRLVEGLIKRGVEPDVAATIAVTLV